MKSMKTAFWTSSKSRGRKKIRNALKLSAPPTVKPESLKVILCDLGNVLVHFDHRIAVRKIHPLTSKSFEEVHQLFFDSRQTKDFEEGRLTAVEFFQEMDKELGLEALGFDEFSRIWSDIFSDNKGILDLLRELKKKFRLHMVSNINELHFKFIQERFPEHIRIFDRLILSYEVGKRKPHREIYQEALAPGFEPFEVLYTDDRQDLIDEAAQLKIPSILFKNVEDFSQTLRRMGVLP